MSQVGQQECSQCFANARPGPVESQLHLKNTTASTEIIARMPNENTMPGEHSEEVLTRNQHDWKLKRHAPRIATERWDDSGNLSTDAFLASNARFNGNFHYIARYKTADGLSPIGAFVGPLVRDRGLLRVPGGRKLAPLTSGYEILMAPNTTFKWIAALDRKPPEGEQAFPSGVIDQNGNPVYIGRRDDVGVGMLRCASGSYDLEFYSSTQPEPYENGFEILCYNRNA